MTVQTSEPEVGALSKAFTICDENYFMSVVVEYTTSAVNNILNKWSGE